VLNFAVIKNAYQAVVVLNPSINGNPKLKLSETIIDNAYDIGLLGINTKVTGQNLLISNCDKNMVLVNGGIYEFTHCTVASYFNRLVEHKNPVLTLSDYLDNSQTTPNNLNATFRNCIFWGEGGKVEDEIKLFPKGSPSLTFENVLWKVKNQPASPTGKFFNNEDPLFVSVDTEKKSYDFRLKENSKAVNTGTNTLITLDLDGNPRPKGTASDLGCYERQ
jgi:hypothetical protein